MKKFSKVVREGKDMVHATGDNVVVLEKLDGANASISINDDLDIKVFSRNNELDEHNTLRGWYGYAIENLAEKLKDIYNDLGWQGEKILFGEWLVSHTVQYKEEYWSKFYPFALYSVEDEKYYPFADVEYVADELGLSTPKVFARERFTSISDYVQYVGMSEMAVDHGEGIVIVNEDSLDEDCRTKIVSEKFSEHKSIKKHVAKDLTESQQWILSNTTQGRVEKIIHKLIDNGMLPEIKFENFGDIAKPVLSNVYEDITEEEIDSRPELFDEKIAIKTLNKKVPVFIRRFIESYSYTIA